MASAASSSPASSPTSSVFDEDALREELARHEWEIENMTPEERDEYDKKQAKLDAEQAKFDAEQKAFEDSLSELLKSAADSPPPRQSLTAIEAEFKDDNEAIMAGMSPSQLADYQEKMRLEEQVEAFLEEAGNALSVNGVFIKTKSKVFGVRNATRQDRLVIIDALGFEWFDKENTERKLGSIPLGRIVGASDAGTWDKLFGVEISHPGIAEGNTFLWCKTPEEHDEVIATVNALVAQAREAANKEGGNKNRKTIIKYRKRRTIRKKNRKGTRTTIRKRQRKNRTRTMRKKARKSRNSNKAR
jgi:hypothetical protein